MQTHIFLRRFSERTEAQRYVRQCTLFNTLLPVPVIPPPQYRLRSSASGHRVYKVTNIEQEK